MQRALRGERMVSATYIVSVPAVRLCFRLVLFRRLPACGAETTSSTRGAEAKSLAKAWPAILLYTTLLRCRDGSCVANAIDIPV